MVALHKRIAEAPTLAVLGLLAYTISVYTDLGERVEALGAIRHEFLAGIVLVGASTFILVNNPLRIQPYRHVLMAIILLFVVMLTQIPFAYDPQHAWTTFFDRIFKQALFAFFLAALIRSPRHLRWFMIALVFSWFWVYQEAVYGLITGSLVWYNQGIKRLHGSVTLYRHPNGLSLIAVTCLPFVICLFSALRRTIMRLALLVVAGLASLCIVYSGSRAGYVGTLGLLFFWWVFSRHKVRGLLVGTIAAAVVLTVIPDQYIERFESIGGEEAEGHSKEGRLEIMSDAWKIFLAHPLGVGVDCFSPVRMETFGRDQDTHNLYLEVATQLGIQGMLIFLFFVGSLLWSFQQIGLRQERLRLVFRRFLATQAPNPPLQRRLRSFHSDILFVRQLGRAGRLYVLMLLVNGCFAHTMYLICWWLASGLAICLLNMTATMEDDLSAI